MTGSGDELVASVRGKKGFGRRVIVAFQSGATLEVARDVAAEKKIHAGQSLSRDALRSLMAAEIDYRCYNAALRLLAYRPRSEGELNQRLRRSRYDDEVIQRALAKLRQQKLIDDAAFCQFWKESRESLSPRGARMIERELRQKGIAQEVAHGVASEVDDTEASYKVAQRKARFLTSLEYGEFEKRLGGYLRRRGFSYQTARQTVNRVWRENKGPDEIRAEE